MSINLLHASGEVQGWRWLEVDGGSFQHGGRPGLALQNTWNFEPKELAGHPDGDNHLEPAFRVDDNGRRDSVPPQSKTNHSPVDGRLVALHSVGREG